MKLTMVAEGSHKVILIKPFSSKFAVLSREKERESNAVKLEGKRGREEESELSVRYFEALMEMGSGEGDRLGPNF